MTSSRASYRWLTISLLIAAGVYASYAITQYGRLNSLNQRQLSNAAAELKSAIDTGVETVTRFNRKWTEWDVKRSDPRTTAVEPHVCDFDTAQPYLDLDECRESASTGQAAQTVSWGRFSSVVAVSKPTLAITASERTPQGAPTAADSRLFRFRTDKLLQELAFPDSFELIFVATAEGRILYQDAPVRRRWLPFLRWGEQQFRDAFADRQPSLQIQNLKDLVGSPEEWTRLRSVTSRTSVQLGGTSHQLYLHPLIPDSSTESDLIVGGAVPTRTIVRSALAVDTDLLGILIFLLLLGVLGFPFVKLASLDRRERFRLRDVNLLYLSTGALLVMLTCASLAYDGYVRWRTVASQGLEALAGHLTTTVVAEIRSLRDQLRVYDKTINGKIPDCTKAVHTKWFGPESSSPLKWPAGLHVRQVAWVGPEGWQHLKTTADPIPGTTSVAQRVYFRAASEGNLFQIAGDPQAGGDAWPFFIAPDRSVSDGKFYTFLSMRSELPPDVCRRSDVVAASGPTIAVATVQLLSLDRPQFPAGYGFALVNREGRVLYHSDRRLSLRENLFEELSSGAQARALIYAGRDGRLTSRYRERPHDFYFQSIPIDRESEEARAGLYLAVFRNTTIERTIVGQTFVTGMVGPMILLLGIYAAGLASIALASRYTDRHWSAWLWPHGGLEHIFRRQAIAFLALLLASALCYLLFDRIGLFLLSPVLAVAFGIGIHIHGSKTKGARSRLSAVGWHASTLLLVLVCMIVAPSAALFRLTLSHEFAKWIVTERAWIGAQQDNLLRAAAFETRGDGYAAERITELTKARQGYFTCVPEPFDAVGPPADREPSGVLEAKAARAPSAGTGIQAASHPARTSDLLTGCRQADRPGGGAGNPAPRLQQVRDRQVVDALHWLDTALPIENEILARQQFQPLEFAYSPDGTVMKSIRASLIAFAGLGLTLGVLAWWIRWNTKRLFLADVDGPAAACPEPPFDALWNDLKLDEQMTLLQIAKERIANPHHRSMVRQLLAKGLLRFNPGLAPCSDEFGAFLRDRERQMQPQMHEWEEVTIGHSWHYVRLILIASVVGLGLFLIVTQPSLQSNVVGIATATTGIVTAGVKMRDAIVAWLNRPKNP